MTKRTEKPELINSEKELLITLNTIKDSELRRVLISLYSQQKTINKNLKLVVSFCNYVKPSAHRMKQLLFKGKNKDSMEKIPITIEKQM